MNSFRKYPDITLDGLPHSEIPGFTVVCTYSGLIAAYHVLHRLLVPRHPSYALSSLTENLIVHIRQPPTRFSNAIPLFQRTNFLYKTLFYCGANRNRTDDLRLAKAALSLLSYSPFLINRSLDPFMVGLSGVEPPTSRLSGGRSNHS